MSFLFVDKILETQPGEWSRGVKYLTEEEVYLCPSEKGKLQFVPSLIGEALGQLAAWNVMSCHSFAQRPVAGLARRARLHRPAYVGETLELEAFIDRLDNTAVEYHAVAHSNGHLIFEIEGAVGPLLPMSEFIDEEEVRQQFFKRMHFSDQITNGQMGSKNVSDKDKLASTETINENKNVSQIQKEILIKNNYNKLFLFDRIQHSNDSDYVIAEKFIPLNAPYFPTHFPKKPVLPMTVLLECKLNLARKLVAQKYHLAYQVKELRRVKMNEFVLPEAIVKCQANIKQEDDTQIILSFRSEVEGKRVCIAEVVMEREEN